MIGDFNTSAAPDPCKNIFQRFFAYFMPSSGANADIRTDNCAVSVFPVGAQAFAATETPRLRRIDPLTLDTLELQDVSKSVPIDLTTAHPQLTTDGTAYNMGSKYGRHGTYNIFEVPPPTSATADDAMSAARLVASIPIGRPLNPSYYHSFAMSDNHIIFIEQPLVISVARLQMNKITGGTVLDAFQWQPEHGVSDN